MKASFTKNDIMVYITGPRNVYQYRLTVLNLNSIRSAAGGFTTMAVEITYVDSGQFFGLEAEAIVFSLRNGGTAFQNYRYAPAIQNVWVLFANPRESDYKCGVDTLWSASYYAIFIFFGLNFVGYFLE